MNQNQIDKIMEYHSETNITTIGFCLLPSHLIQNILLHLCLPEIIRMKQVSKYVLNTIEDQNFIRIFNSESQNDSWLFIYTRRWCRDGTIYGFSNRSTRWFKIPVSELLTEEIFPGEDLYLLTTNGNFLLFASNTCNGIIAVNLVNKTTRRICQSPLGPRGTSSWRRSGMKLITGPPESGQFRFLFAEMVDNRPVLFVYDSRTNTWESKDLMENMERNWKFREKDKVFLNISNRPPENIMIMVEDEILDTHNRSMILRPRFNQNMIGQQPSVVGFSRTDLDNQVLYIYSDGYKVIIGLDVIRPRIKKANSIEVWSISRNGEKWELVSRVPDELIKRMNKPCGVMMGCLERRLSMIRVVLLSNLEGLWNIIWLNYDKERDKWEWVPLPDCRFLQGSNVVGVSLSSGLTLC